MIEKDNDFDNFQEVREEKQIEKIQSSSLAKFEQFKNVQEMLDFAQVLINSGLVPNGLNKPEKVVAVITLGKELGFGAVTSIGNINNIQGKPTLGIHAIMALVKKANVRYEIIKDCLPIYSNGTNIPSSSDDKIINKECVVNFYERWGDRIITNSVKFTWKEAEKQELTTKSNWIKMPNIMLRNRTLAIGARIAAPDALMGMYETTELADAHNITVELDEEGSPLNIK